MSAYEPGHVPTVPSKRVGIGAFILTLVGIVGISLILGFGNWVCSDSPYLVVERKQALYDARENQAVATRFRAENPAETCPWFATLRATRQLTGSAATGVDPWGTPFKIVCGAELTVVSFGPDQKENTSDDIRN